MKYKKLILILSLLIVTILYIIFPYLEVKSTDSFKENIIRFHIKANSDREEDQSLKIKIRDEVLKEIGQEFGKSKSIEETRTIVNKNLNNMKSIAENIIEDEGKNYSVNISLGNENFPTRRYGDITFPAGEYETVMLTIGEGKGKNWWCVMFPPLCFVDITHSNTHEVKEDLKEVLTEEEINLLLSNKDSNIILKSKIAEILERTKTYFAQKFARKDIREIQKGQSLLHYQ